MGYTGHKHGMYGSKTYEAWNAMKKRCNNKLHKFYPQYGGRGISYDQRWESFEEFFKDMGIADRGMTLDRIDNNSGYSKENCRWVSMKVQCNNRRSNVIVEYLGKSQTVAQWADEVGLERKTLEYRIRVGWSPEKALTTPSTIKRK